MILPSSLLNTESGEETGIFNHSFKNFSLKTGVIIECHEIDDPKNIGKIGPEYDVAVYEQIEDRSVTSTVYSNCTYLESFGGIGDFLEVKKRIPTKKSYKNDQKVGKQNGAMVLMLCIDGVSDKGIIIGAITHPARKTKLTKDKGHHLEGEFNGLNWQIDKDGALVVTFKSASDNDGKYKNAKAGGSTVKIEKDGSIQASDGNKEKIRIDKTKKTIDVTAEKDISVTTDANANITAKSNINAKATASLLAEAGGSATLKSGGAFNIDSGGAFMLKAPSANMMIDGAAMVKASSINLMAPSVMIAGGSGGPAVTMTTQFMGIGNLGMPVISIAIGPFSASTLMGG